jgi:hypothetical protein
LAKVRIESAFAAGEREKISVRTAHDYMLLAGDADVSQRAASVRDALELIGAKRRGRGQEKSRASSQVDEVGGGIARPHRAVPWLPCRDDDYGRITRLLNPQRATS